MGRAPCCDNVGLKKGPWTAEEDQKLLAYIKDHGHGSWRSLPAKAGLLRCGKSCRLRWTNYLRSDIKRGKFSLQEEQTIIQFHALLGNRWSAIAAHLPQRTDNEIKNYWNTHLKKRLEKMGIDPVTHKRKCESLRMTNGQQSKSASALSHMAQWESARLEAEARLARESKLRTGGLSGPLTNGGAVCTYAIADAGKVPNASRSFSPFYSSTGTHLDVMKLKSLLFRTKRHPNTSSAVGPMSADQPENQQQAFALTDSLAESPTSTLSFAEMNNYPDQKPAQQEVVCRSLIEPADTTMAARRDDVQSSILDDNSLLLPNFHDVMFPCSDGNCSSARSFSEERSAIELSETDGAKTLDEISSSAEFNAEDHYGFLTDLLSDLSCFPHSGSENGHAVIMSNAENRDYWSSILDMVNSPQPHNSCVQSIF